MTKEIREAMLKVSEFRSKLNAESSKEQPDSELLEKLRKQSLDGEKELRTALAADSDDSSDGQTLDREAREKRELRSKSRLHRYIAAAISGRGVGGPEAEYSAAEGCDGLVPLSLFGPTAEERQREMRAVTPGPADSDVQQNQGAIVPAIFSRSIAPWLGVEMPR